MSDHVIDGPDAALDSEVLDLAARIFDMARNGHTATLADYLDAGVPANLANTNGDTLVMLAAYYGHASTVGLLIACGAEVDRHNNRGQTPLAGAVFKNEITIVELLVGADADPLAGAPSALETARFFGKERLARQLLQHMQGRSGNVQLQRARDDEVHSPRTRVHEIVSAPEDSHAFR
jgi:uncharacterized protein